MTPNDNTTSAIADLRLIDEPPTGRLRWSLLRQPVFIRGFLLMFGYAVTQGFLQFLLKKHLVSSQIKDLYTVGLYLWLFIGGLWLIGNLGPARFWILLLNISVYQLWDYHFYYSNPEMYFFVYPVLITWPVFYFAWKNPAMMAGFGIRRHRIAHDLLAALAAALAIAAYTAVLFKVNGFHFRHLPPWRVAAHAAGMLGQGLVIVNFNYSVWSRMREKGMSHGGGLALVFALTFALYFPLVSFHYFAGVVTLGKAVAGVGMGVLLFGFITWASFRWTRSTLMATFVMAAINEILLLAGIL